MFSCVNKSINVEIDCTNQKLFFGDVRLTVVQANLKFIYFMQQWENKLLFCYKSFGTVIFGFSKII